jgi:branched-subunit amino acid ABC-type transport system permease component
MKDLLPFVIVGLASGSIYGLAGIGLVLTYRTAGVFNFAHGAVAALGAFAFYELRTTHGWPWPIALVLAVAGVGILAGAAISWLTRHLAGARTEISLVATVGLLLLIQGFLIWKFGGTTRIFPAFLSTKTVSIGGVGVQYGQIIVMIVATLLAAGLYLFLRLTTIGSVMRGVVDDRALVSLTGYSPDRVQRLAWMLGSGLAALSGVLIAPSLGLDASLLTLLVVQAFGACAIGLFSSLPLTFAGGLIVGVAGALATKFGTTRVLQGLAPSVPFLILFLALLVVPARKLRAGQRTARFRPQLVLPPRVMALVTLAGIGLLALVPVVAGVRLTSYTAALALVPALISLAVLVYLSGSISLCHAAFAALGATTFAHLTDFGLPWLVALVLAGAAVVPLGAIVAIPAIRLQGIYLALATFGFGILLEKVAYPAAIMFGTIGAVQAPRPHFLGIDGSTEKGFYVIVLMVALVTAGLIVGMVRNRMGRLLRAMSDSPTALSTHGLSVNVTRVLVFCLAAALAGVSGALIASQAGRVGATGFTSFQSLVWLAVLLVCGRRPVLAPFLAAALLVVMPAYAPDGFVNYQTMLFGATAIAATLLPEINVGRRLEASEERRLRSPVRARAGEVLVPARQPVGALTAGGLG